jgi:hypothetical protein
VRTGTSNATYTGNTAGHSFVAAEVNTVGTWTYYRELRDNTCNTATWSRSSGSYKLTVITCPYTGSDLYLDATHLCQQRTSGAKNWEAYIKDSRDSKIYRITQFSDASWWMAEDLATATNRYATCNGSSYYSTVTNKTSHCPSSWSLPTFSQIKTRYPNGVVASDDYGGAMTTNGWIVGVECGGLSPDCRNEGLNTLPFIGFYVMADYYSRLSWCSTESRWDCACKCADVPACCATEPWFTDQYARVRCRRKL